MQVIQHTQIFTLYIIDKFIRHTENEKASRFKKNLSYLWPISIYFPALFVLVDYMPGVGCSQTRVSGT